jgi:DNA gyrase subunit B
MSDETNLEVDSKVEESTQSGNYTAANITVLEGMEAVRKRPAMYIGDTGERGYHHLVYEVVDNSVDESLAGYCSHVDVVINPDGSVSVTDNGRGIPVDMHPVEKRPALEVVLTTLHAGGKFDGSNYKVSGGLHGVGVSCVNALSDWMVVEVRRDGKIYRQRFERGIPASELEVIGDTQGTGTKVTFLPDHSIFTCRAFRILRVKWSVMNLSFLMVVLLSMWNILTKTRALWMIRSSMFPAHVISLSVKLPCSTRRLIRRLSIATAIISIPLREAPIFPDSARL